MSEAYESWTFTRAGHEFRATLHHDSDHGEPWKEEDGHGEVTEWTRRAKQPGEMVLNEDRGSRRYYDFAGAMAKAKAEGWGLCDDEKAKLATKLGRTPTAGDIRHAAVMADFEHLRAWCNDEWHYCGVKVALVADDDQSASVWGIESDADDYLRETAEELADELLAGLQDDEASINAALVELARTAAGLPMQGAA